MTSPILTVVDGLLIDNNVAIPMIFPGPLLILPQARAISPAGEQALVDQARDLGLLEGATDFTGGGVAPGGITGTILIIADGERFELTGDPNRLQMCNDRPCPVDPGTPEAFGAYWWLLSDTTQWLAANLGQPTTYQPERLAVLLVEPAADNSGLAPTRAEWPLADFDTFGQPFNGGATGQRCATVEGEDLAALLPVLLASNQLSVFVDSTGVEHSVQARALVPDEESPCA
jgi:hypothetical protein